MSIRQLLFAVPIIATLCTPIEAQTQPQTLALAERPGGDRIESATRDGHGGIWAVGSGTISPTPDAFHPAASGATDGFLIHVGPDGTLLYGTYLGGGTPHAVTRDASDDIYVAGATTSTSFPTTSGAFQQTTNGSQNGFVMKFDPSGEKLLYSTYLGGSAGDAAFGIAADAAGNAHVVGSTQCNGFPVTYGRCLYSYASQLSAFYARLSPDGHTLLFSTTFDASWATGVAVGTDGDAYVVGEALPTFSPMDNAIKTQFPAAASSQGFLARLTSASANPIVFSTLIGGSSTDHANGVAVSSHGIYVAGTGDSTDYPGAPVRQPVTYSDPTLKDATGWVMKVRLDGQGILGTTLFDGNGTDDEALAVAVDVSEVVHVAGWTDSTNFPVSPDAAQSTLRGRVNAWYATAWMPNNVVGDPSYVTYLGGNDIDRARTVALDAGNLDNPSLSRGGGAWIAGESSSTDFPSVNAKTSATSAAYVAWFAVSPTGANAPGVWVTSPAAGATFTAPATVPITASTAEDAGTATTRVDFYAGGVLLGTSTTQPYGITWNDVPAGSYNITAIATNTAGGIGVSTPVSITVTSNAGGGGGTGLPQGWIDTDVGAVGAAGSAVYSNGTFTVEGSGADVWGTADAFNYVYQPLSGDGTIVARVASVSSEANWVKAGVMIRGSLSPSSAQAFMLVSHAKGTAFQRRVSDGNTTVSTAGAFSTAPYWVKLVRAGNVITGYESADGSSWTMVGSDTFTMGANAYVGLAVSSHVAGTLATGTFDSVAITAAAPPPPADQCSSVSLSQTFFYSGGPASNWQITVTAPSATCTWTASIDQSWLLLNGTPGPTTITGTGSGTVTLQTLDNNTGAYRYGTFTIGGTSYKVTQEPF